MATAGLKLIVPTSVDKAGASSTASIGANGKVTFGLCTSLSVNGVFSATYDDYLCVVQLKSAANPNTNLKLRASGTDASTNYTYQYLIGLSTSVTAARATTQSSALIGSPDTLANGDHLYFYGPYLAAPTALRSITATSISSAGIYDVASTHSTASAYDGFTYIASASTITGTLTVYGLSQ